MDCNSPEGRHMGDAMYRVYRRYSMSVEWKSRYDLSEPH